MKSYKINIMFGGAETSVYMDSDLPSADVTTSALSMLGLGAEAWISTEEYVNG